MTRKDWAIATLGFVLLVSLVVLPELIGPSLGGGGRRGYVGDVPTQPWGVDQVLPGGR